MSNIIYNTFLNQNIQYYSNLNKQESLNLYKEIIRFRKKNKISKEEIYCENHHIISKSICKNKLWKNSTSNLVNLLPYEHFICHYLLTKIINKKSLIHAFWMMCIVPVDTNKKDYIKNLDIFKESKEYEDLRNKRSNIMSDFLKGENNPMYGKNPWNKNKKNIYIVKQHYIK